MKKFIAIVLVAMIAVCMFAGCDTTRVEAKVISCEETEPYVNGAAKVQSTVNFINGNYTNAMLYGSMSQPQARYNVVVEYNGVQYEITTSKSYSIGEIIKVDLPIED